MLIRRFTGHRRRSSDGQAMIEFVFCLPLLLMILFGIIEFSRLYAIWYTAEQACFEGARLAAEKGLQPTDVDGITVAQVQGRVNAIMQSIGNLTPQSVTVTEVAGASSTDVVVRLILDIPLHWAPTHIGNRRLFATRTFRMTFTHRARLR